MTCAAFAPLCTITGATTTTLRDDEQQREQEERQEQSSAAAAASLVLRRQVIIHVMSSILVFVLLLPLCFAWPNNATGGPDPSTTNVTATNGTVVPDANSTVAGANFTTVVNGTDLVGPNNFTNFTAGAALSQFSTRVAPANAATLLSPLHGGATPPGTDGSDGLTNGDVLTKLTQFSPVGPGRGHADRARAGFVDHQAGRDRAPDDRDRLRPDALLDRVAKIHLVPAGMPFLTVDYDDEEMMLMEVALPTTEFMMCTSNNVPKRPKCSGEFELDLSSSNGELEIAFQAPDGREIEIDNNGGRGKLELAFKARNLGHLFVCNDDMKQRIKNFVPVVTGSRIDGLGSPKEAKIEIDPCSLDTRVEFDLSKSDDDIIRFKRVSWTVSYKPRMFRRDESKLTYKTNTAMWIRANRPRLV